MEDHFANWARVSCRRTSSPPARMCVAPANYLGMIAVHHCASKLPELSPYGPYIQLSWRFLSTYLSIKVWPRNANKRHPVAGFMLCKIFFFFLAPFPIWVHILYPSFICQILTGTTGTLHCKVVLGSLVSGHVCCGFVTLIHSLRLEFGNAGNSAPSFKLWL